MGILITSSLNTRARVLGLPRARKRPLPGSLFFGCATRLSSPLEVQLDLAPDTPTFSLTPSHNLSRPSPPVALMRRTSIALFYHPALECVSVIRSPPQASTSLLTEHSFILDDSRTNAPNQSSLDLQNLHWQLRCMLRGAVELCCEETAMYCCDQELDATHRPAPCSQT